MARVVLPVAVDLDRDVVAVLERELVAGLHGAADPEVERVPQTTAPRHRGLLGRVVGRPVVDDHTSKLGRVLVDSRTVTAMAPASL